MDPDASHPASPPGAQPDAAPGDVPITVTDDHIAGAVRFTPDDWLIYWRWYYLDRPEALSAERMRYRHAKNQYHKTFLAAAVGMFALWMWHAHRVKTGADLEGEWLGGLALMLVLVVYFFSNVPKPVDRSAQLGAYRDQIRKNPPAQRDGWWRFECTPRGLRVTGDGVEYAVGWSRVHGVYDRPDAVLVHSDIMPLMIPNRLFADGQRDAAVRRIADWARSAPGSDASRIAAYLAHHDAKCPECRHNLRGLRDLACPECGAMISRYDVPEPFAAEAAGASRAEA